MGPSGLAGQTAFAMVDDSMKDQPAPRTFRSQKLLLHYADWGGDLPVLILLHGGNDHGRSWDTLARALSDRFRVIAPDLRGHGDSGWSDDGHYSITAHVPDLLALYETLGIQRAPIVAHSMGGMIALRFAGLYPAAVSRLILLDSATRSTTEAARLAIPVEHRITIYYEKLRKAVAATLRPYATVEEAAARLKVKNPSLSNELAHHLAGHATRLGADGMRRWKFDPRCRVVSPYDLSSEEKRRLRWQVTAPILLLDGALSYGAPDGVPLDLPNAERIVVPSAGHWVHYDRPDEVIAAIRAFLGNDPVFRS
jgi:pimeloyl-ACP methyl ester carboxylesterase